MFRPPKNRKWAHTVLGTLEPWFSLIDFDRNFRPSKCSQEVVCITTQQNSHFQAYNCKKWGHKKLGTLKPLVLRLSRNHIRKSPKWRQRDYTSFTLGRNSIFRTTKCIKWSTRKYVHLNRRFHDSPKIEIIRLPKCRKCAHTNLGMLEPRVSRFGRNQETRRDKTRRDKRRDKGQFAFSCLQNARNVVTRS